jgi:hypothetical protein
MLKMLDRFFHVLFTIQQNVINRHGALPFSNARSAW